MADFNVTRVFVALIAGLHAALFAPDAPAQAQAPPQRPNVVVILGDDLGFADLGSFGSEIKTPNLDRLVRRGVACTNAYSSCPVCVPARYTLMTGCEPSQTSWLYARACSSLVPCEPCSRFCRTQWKRRSTMAE